MDHAFVEVPGKNLVGNTPSQECPKCKSLIGVLAGSIDAICKNCGYKDPCCE